MKRQDIRELIQALIAQRRKSIAAEIRDCDFGALMRRLKEEKEVTE